MTKMMLDYVIFHQFEPHEFHSSFIDKLHILLSSLSGVTFVIRV